MYDIIFNNEKNVIYKNLRLLRRKHGFSQEQLAAKMQLMNVNLNQQMISAIERNRRFVTDYELACFCRVFGVTTKEMLSDFYEKYPE